MSRHAYPLSALAGDYARAAAGLALALPPLVLLPLNRYVFAVFALLAALFLLFAWRTLLRQLGPIEMSEEAIASLGPFATRLEWAGLDEMKLAYYATRRDGRSGWMQLALRAGGRRLRLDSRIEGFAAIVARAVAAARQRGLPLSAATASNVTALGIALAPAEA
ncbi:MAG TPA: hypothetical protein VFA50_16005 [Stellaceae bacterium]|nr:hypothetical protein [Stellaceae bacterium]